MEHKTVKEKIPSKARKPKKKIPDDVPCPECGEHSEKFGEDEENENRNLKAIHKPA